MDTTITSAAIKKTPDQLLAIDAAISLQEDWVKVYIRVQVNRGILERFFSVELRHKEKQIFVIVAYTLIESLPPAPYVLLKYLPYS